jgi:hypothetical protein
VNGAVPVAAPTVVTVRSGSAIITARITVDAVHNELRWQVTSSDPASVAAVVLRRRGGGTITGPASGTTGSAPAMARMTITDSAQRVVARLMGPGMRTATGSLPLAYAERLAFAEGKLSVAVQPVRGGVLVERAVPSGR